MTDMFTKTIKNNPALKGSPAIRKHLFGECSRFAIAPIHTRFDYVQWFVWDAHKLDSDGKPDVIRQFDSSSDAAMFVLMIKDGHMPKDCQAYA